MKKILLTQLIKYPLVFSLLWLIVYIKMPDNFIVSYLINVVSKVFPQNVDVGMNVQIVIYGFFFGFVYGIFSLLLKARDFKVGLLFIIVFVVKSYFAMLYALTYGVLGYFLTLILIPVFLFLNKKGVLQRVKFMKIKSSSNVQ